MKKLMIYTKRRKINIYDIIIRIKDNSNIIMLISIFVCGLLLGSTFAIIDSEIPNIFVFNNENTLDFALPVLLYIFVFLSGFNCVGIPFICCVPALFGYCYGYNFAELITKYGSNDYIILILKNLFPATLICFSIILMSNFALRLSAETAGIIILKKENKVNIRNYMLIGLILLLFFSIGLIIKTVI